ncbi:MAG: cupin domain-containing protein [Chloroflexaceae bacterium]
MGAGYAAGSEVDVGGALRALREARRLSIRALAEQSGLAVNTLSLIEHGKTSPSVSTLQQLAASLDVPITAFFEHNPELQPIVLTRSCQRPCVLFDQGTLEDLGARLPDCPIEPFLVTLAPNAGSGAAPITHTGHEFVLCLAGHIRYTVQQHDFRLTPGDSLLFEATLPHCWHNAGATESRMLMVFAPTCDHFPPEHVHFAVSEQP